MHNLLTVLLSFLFLSQVGATIPGTGLQYSLAGDLVYRQGLDSDHQDDGKLKIREAELIFYGPIDHNFDGVFSLAAHDEGGEVLFEMHELFIESSRILPRVHFKVGQFFLGIGRLNRFHRHDWPFTVTPLAHDTFLDEEGVMDTGLETTWLLPTKSYWQLTTGITSGHTFGHAHTSGAKPKVPTHYARLSRFHDWSRGSGLDWGLNYLGRKDSNKENKSLFGLDITAKWRGGRILRWNFQSEWWYQVIKGQNDDKKESLGGYFFLDHGLSTRWFVGGRTDFFKELDRRDALSSNRVNHVHYGLGPQVTFFSSEFSYFRATLFHEFERVESRTLDKDFRFELQFVFILGAHPAHNF